MKTMLEKRSHQNCEDMEKTKALIESAKSNQSNPPQPRSEGAFRRAAYSSCILEYIINKAEPSGVIMLPFLTKPKFS